ncbi:MAG: hypothetical protein J6D08_00195 [Lachnospiraceae bacterium]|nr:hypothetical protein [Lachnospiraceae bacterium]
MGITYNKTERKESISYARDIGYERIDSANWNITPKCSEVPVTSELDVSSLTIDKAGVKNTRKRPSIKEMI